MPETMLRNVLLPQPEGPTIETKLLPLISKSIPSSAHTTGWSLVGGGNSFTTFSAFSTAKSLPPPSSCRLHRAEHSPFSPAPAARCADPLDAAPPLMRTPVDPLDHAAVEDDDDRDDDQR